MKIHIKILFCLLFFSSVTNAQRADDCKQYLDTITENSSVKRSELYYLEDDYKPDFKLLKTIGVKIDTLKIRTDGIYVREKSHYDGKNHLTAYSFYRFFNDGKVYISCTYLKIPENEEASKIDYGKFSEYMVKNDEVIIETDERGSGKLSYYQIVGNKFSLVAVSSNEFDENVKIYKLNGKFYDCDFHKIQFKH